MNKKHTRFIQGFLIFLMASFLTTFAASWAIALDSGDEKAPASVVSALSAGQPQDMIVLVDDSGIKAAASQMLTAIGAKIETPEVLSFKSEGYASIKDDVISALPDGEFELKKDYSHLPMFFLSVKTSACLSQLLEDERVLQVYEDKAHRHFLSQSLPLIGQPSVEAAGMVGTGTTVAVLDTGLDYTKSAFGSCTGGNAPGYCSDTNPPAAPSGCLVACARDFTPSDDGKLDADGHGTNVSGIVVGVAPDTRIAALDVFRGLYAYTSDITAAINWCIANKAAYNIVAINMSLGGGTYSSPCASDPFATPVANARAAGILSSIASGNDADKDSISSPACVPSAVSVGAVYDANVGPMFWSSCTDSSTYADKVTCFSNSAYFLTMLAPGALIDAAGITMAGTSQAAPHVAGSIAVLKGGGAFPADTPDQTVSRMTSTGESVTDPANGITKPRIDLLTACSGGGGTYSISGTVTSDTGSPLSGVTMTLGGDGSATTTTNASGEYSFSDLANGSYTVTPSLTGYTFNPTNRNVTIDNADETGKNFIGTPSSGTYSVSGLVRQYIDRRNKPPMEGVTITLSGDASATTTTDASGNYTFSGLAAGRYTITPSKAGFIFYPASRTGNLNQNITGANFWGVE